MTVEITVVGAGKIGTKHARILESFPDATVSHVVDTDTAAAADLAATVDATASDLDRALDDSAAVYVCTPDDAHTELARRAIDAGRHTFVEKPLATTVTEADDLVAAADGGVHMVGHVLRFDARYRILRDETSRVGEVCSATAERLVSRARARRTGGASPPAMRLGVHDFDLLAWLLDDRIEQVRALAADGALRTEGYDVADVVNVLVQFAGGAAATVTLGFCLPAGQPDSMVRTTVVGTEGVATVDAGSEVRSWDGEGGRAPDTHLWPTIEGVPAGALEREDRAFVDAVRRGGDSPVPFAAGRDAVAVAEAVQEAIARGGAVVVP